MSEEQKREGYVCTGLLADAQQEGGRRRKPKANGKRTINFTPGDGDRKVRERLERELGRTPTSQEIAAELEGIARGKQALTVPGGTDPGAEAAAAKPSPKGASAQDTTRRYSQADVKAEGQCSGFGWQVLNIHRVAAIYAVTRGLTDAVWWAMVACSVGYGEERGLVLKSPSEIAEAIGAKPNSVRNAIAKLAAAGLVITQGTGRATRRFLVMEDPADVA